MMLYWETDTHLIERVKKQDLSGKEPRASRLPDNKSNNPNNSTTEPHRITVVPRRIVTIVCYLFGSPHAHFLFLWTSLLID